MPESSFEPQPEPEPEPIVGEIPDERILNTPFEIAGHRVDLMLPADVKERFSQDKEKIVAEAKRLYGDENFRERNAGLNELELYNFALAVSVAKQARLYTHDWEERKHMQEGLSLKENCAGQEGECTERTNFLYALMMHAKEEFKGEEMNLNHVDFAFAQVFDFKRENHNCLLVKTGSNTKLLDIGYALQYQDSVVDVEADYKMAAETDLRGQVALALCNKGEELVKQGKMKEARETYAAARRIAPNNAYVVAAPPMPFVQRATYHYNRAARLIDEGNKDMDEGKRKLGKKKFKEADEQLKQAKKYAAQAERVMASMQVEITDDMEGAKYVSRRVEIMRSNIRLFQSA